MIWEEPARGGYPEPTMVGLPGVEQLRAFLKRGGPIPPMGHLTGLRPTEFSVGGSTFTMPASPWLLAPVGLMTGGVLALPADAVLGCAVQSALPAGVVYTTSEVSMSFVRAATSHSGALVARGRLVHGGRSLALSEATVVDASGRLLAFATSRCFVFPPLDELPEPPPLDTYEPPTYETPDPYLRVVDGEVIVQDVWDKMSGLEVLQAEIAGELPHPPIHHLTGLRPVEASEGKAAFVLPATAWLTSPIGTVQGGFLLLLADSALACAVQTTVPAGSAYATVDIKVNYLRPVYPNGSELTAHAEVVHRGRNLAVAQGEVVNAEGKVVCLATGATHILSGRTWAYEER